MKLQSTRKYYIEVNRRNDTYYILKKNNDQTTCQCIKPQFESSREVEEAVMSHVFYIGNLSPGVVFRIFCFVTV